MRKTTERRTRMWNMISLLPTPSVGNSHRSASPRPTTLEEDRELFVDFSSILCLWFEIQAIRTYNFFDWVSNTADAYSVSWAEIWEFSKSRRDIFDAITISKIIVFEIICNFAYYSAAKFTFPIKQPSNKATKFSIRRSWKLKVKPNLVRCSNIAITISYISVFVSSW